MPDFIKSLQEDKEQLQIVNETFSGIMQTTKPLWNQHNPSDFGQLENFRKDLIRIYSDMYKKNKIFWKVLKELNDAFFETTTNAHGILFDSWVQNKAWNKADVISKTGKFAKLQKKEDFKKLITDLGFSKAIIQAYTNVRDYYHSLINWYINVDKNAEFQLIRDSNGNYVLNNIKEGPEAVSDFNLENTAPEGYASKEETEHQKPSVSTTNFEPQHMPRDGDPKQTETVDDLEESYKLILQQHALEIDLLNKKIEQLIKTDQRLERRCTEINAKCDKIKVAGNTKSTKDKPSLKQSVIAAFHHLKEEWPNFNQKEGTVDEFFKKYGEDNYVWHKAQSRFYNWLSTNRDTRFVFNLEPFMEQLEQCREMYKNVDWKKIKDPSRFECFQVPTGFGEDATTSGNQKLTDRRIKEAWQKAVSFTETEMIKDKNGKRVPKAGFYDRDDNGNLRDPLTMFGSNMPPCTYALVFD